MQQFTSKNTSINSTKLPTVYRKATFSAPYVLDYGCGKYTEHIKSFIESQGKSFFPYDKYNQDMYTNRNTLDFIEWICSRSAPVKIDVVCSNVLNVIDSDSEVQYICSTIEYIVSRSGGKGFVTVYDGDRSGVGRQTGKDQYQRNEPIKNYIKYFKNAHIHNGMIIVER